jgi:hypothetical protein
MDTEMRKTKRRQKVSDVYQTQDLLDVLLLLMYNEVIMTIQIKNRWTGEVITKSKTQTLKDLASDFRANLSGANLSRDDLSGANLSGANLSRADLSRANLSEADLSGANLYIANLSGSDLSEASLSEANLSGTNLSKADLSRADLYRADLSGANLSGANLSGADLYDADLYETDLSGTDLSGTDLSGAKGIVSFIAGGALAVAFFHDGKTKLKIGCEVHTLKHWKSNYKKIGKKHGYTAAQIDQYGLFIKAIKSLKRQRKRRE